MCEHGTLTYLFLDGELVPIDFCISPLIMQLRLAGIKTESSCCGHGKDYPYVVCERGTERKLKNFGCKSIVPVDYGFVRANFRVLSFNGKVYIRLNKKSGK